MIGRRDIDDPERFDRPRRHTRPRTKQRPTYDDAHLGFVVAVDRGRYTVRLHVEGTERTVTAMKSRPLGRQGVVVGDQVQVVGDVSGAEGTLARIVTVQDRETVLRRTADDTDRNERVIVANARRLVIVTAVTDPEPRPRLIDRCLVAAYDAGLEPLLCVTKVDLADPTDLLHTYRPLGVSSIALHKDSDLSPLRSALHGSVSVLVGHSGVGKSTLVNALVPGASRSVGEVNASTGRGRHTSTSVRALQLAAGSWVIDTPGIRSFGLAHVEPDHLIEAFDDLAACTADCPRGCGHTATAPECALDTAIADGRVDPARVDSFRRLLDSRSRTVGD